MWIYAAVFISGLTNQLKPANFISFRLLPLRCRRQLPRVIGFLPLSLKTHSRTLSKSTFHQQKASCTGALPHQVKKDLSHKMVRSLFLLIIWTGAFHHLGPSFSETFCISFNFILKTSDPILCQTSVIFKSSVKYTFKKNPVLNSSGNIFIWTSQTSLLMDPT